MNWLVKCILLIDTILLFILFGQLVHIGLSFWRKELKVSRADKPYQLFLWSEDNDEKNDY